MTHYRFEHSTYFHLFDLINVPEFSIDKHTLFKILRHFHVRRSFKKMSCSPFNVNGTAYLNCVNENPFIRRSTLYLKTSILQCYLYKPSKSYTKKNVISIMLHKWAGFYYINHISLIRSPDKMKVI